MGDGNIVYKTAIINAAASGDRTVVAAVTGAVIAVHAYVIKTDATGGTLRWENGAGGTALSGVFIMAAADQIVAPFSEVPWFKTSAATLLALEVGLGDMDGHIIYSEAS